MPTVLVNREVDRRVEEFARQLSDQKIDPRQANIDWAQFKGKRVLIRGCANAVVPTWAFLILTAHLAEYVERIYFGELRSAVKIFVKGTSLT